jgi:hypothetical protein
MVPDFWGREPLAPVVVDCAEEEIDWTRVCRKATLLLGVPLDVLLGVPLDVLLDAAAVLHPLFHLFHLFVAVAVEDCIAVV